MESYFVDSDNLIGTLLLTKDLCRLVLFMIIFLICGTTMNAFVTRFPYVVLLTTIQWAIHCCSTCTKDQAIIVTAKQGCFIFFVE